MDSQFSLIEKQLPSTKPIDPEWKPTSIIDSWNNEPTKFSSPNFSQSEREKIQSSFDFKNEISKTKNELFYYFLYTYTDNFSISGVQKEKVTPPIFTRCLIGSTVTYCCPSIYLTITQLL